MAKLTNKVIVVTGGSGLLGSAFIKAIETEGGIAINADIDCSTDVAARKYYCNINSADTVENLIYTVANKYGKIDGWINNAYPRTEDWSLKFEDIPLHSWQKNIDMHLNGYFICSQLILKQMKKQNYGVLLNLGSIYGIVGPDFTIYEGTTITNPAAYAAIKGALINFSRYLASYYGMHNIRVNCISPGGIFDHQDAKFIKNYENKVPLKRMGIPEDIAPSAVFLLSDDSKYITGHNLVIDGGWSII